MVYAHMAGALALVFLWVVLVWYLFERLFRSTSIVLSVCIQMELRVLPRNFLKQGVSAEYGWGVARRGVVPPFGLSLFIYL